MAAKPDSQFTDPHYLLTERVDDLVRGAPIVSLTGIFAALALATVFGGTAWQIPVALWLAAIVVVNLARLFLPMMVDSTETETVRAQKLWKGHALCGHANSVAFSIGMPLLIADAGAIAAGFALLVFSGLLSAQLTGARRAPTVAYGFVVLVTLGASVGILMGTSRLALPMIIVLFAQAAILMRIIATQEAGFLDRTQKEFDRRDNEATVRQLLADYELHSCDWLWTADREGRLRAVSDRFGEASGRGAEVLEGLPFAELFAPGIERDALAASIKRGEPFRDLTVPLLIGEEKRIWTLSARVLADRRYSGFARDVTEAEEAKDKVVRMSHYDALTGLPNRTMFNRVLTHAAQDVPDGLTLFYCDLDDFKSINETQGHALGDRLLKTISQRLKEAVNTGDFIARLGGDEFAVIIYGEDSDRGAADYARKLIDILAEPFSIGGMDLRVTACIGIARNGAETNAAQELLRRADLALYSAKRRGRGRYAMFERALDEAVRERRSIEQELRIALSHRQFELHYQPIIELDAGRITGHEALLRWQHPARGEILPGRFIPVAEDSGLIIPVGEWVIGEALREVAGWDGDTRIAINLSPVQMRSPNLVPVITLALEETGLDPARLELEITEGALMRNVEANRAVLLKLRELGIRIALDDFGTGYSSLSYLRSFPFDKIKIDRAFVKDVVEQADSQAIIAAVTRLAAALGMQTTAEGVEHVEQLEMLRKLGCSEAQGFLIAKPARASELDPEEAELALPSPLPTQIIDYRKARRAAQRKAKQARGGERARQA